MSNSAPTDYATIRPTDILTSYVDFLQSHHRSKHTIDLRRRQIRSFLEYYPDPWRASTDDLREWLSMNKNWSAATKASARDALLGFYGWLIRTNRLGRSPAADLLPVRVPQRVARPAPMGAIIEAYDVSDERTKLMIELGVRAGLRRAEIATLHSEDVSGVLGDWVLYIRGKGDKERIIPIDDEFAERLLERGPGYIFSKSGDPSQHLTPKYVGELISKVLPDDWSAHSLRHHFATAVYSGTQDLVAVQQLLGHSSVATTQRYVAITRNGLRQAAGTVRFKK